MAAARHLGRQPGSNTLGLLLREPLVAVVIIAIAAALMLFVLYPLFMVLQASLMRDGRLSLAIFGELLAKAHNRTPFVNSITLGTLVALFGTAVGFVFAYATTRIDLPGRRFFKLMATFPMISPPFIISLATILL